MKDLKDLCYENRRKSVVIHIDIRRYSHSYSIVSKFVVIHILSCCRWIIVELPLNSRWTVVELIFVIEYWVFRWMLNFPLNGFLLLNIEYSTEC